MITITDPTELPDVWHRCYQVKDEAEAEKIRAGRVAYFRRSRVIKACYLYIPMEEE